MGAGLPLVVLAALLVFLAGRLRAPLPRRIGQALGVLLLAAGLLRLASAPGNGVVSLPGTGPRRWHAP